MIAVILPSLLCLPSKSFANVHYFEDCTASPKKYQQLNDYMAEHEEGRSPDLCWEISNNKTLVLYKNTGSASQGLYAFNSSARTFEKISSTSRIIDVLYDDAEQVYFLTSGYSLKRGTLTTYYGVLTARKADGEVNISTLIWTREDGESGMCGRIKSGIATSVDKKDVKVRRHGNKKSDVVFRVTQEECVTRKKTSYNRVFSLKNGKFVDLNPVSAPLPTSFVDVDE
jgi:hypothetical protein